MAMRIYIAGAIDIRDGVDHNLGNLAASGPVEIRQFESVIADAVERRKVLAAA
jgi:hypothetical protein